jgi:hypothetical protein
MNSYNQNHMYGTLACRDVEFSFQPYGCSPYKKNYHCCFSVNKIRALKVCHLKSLALQSWQVSMSMVELTQSEN